MIGRRRSEFLQRRPRGPEVAQKIRKLPEAIPRGQSPRIVGRPLEEFGESRVSLAEFTEIKPRVRESKAGVITVLPSGPRFDKSFVFLDGQIVFLLAQQTVGKLERIGYTARSRLSLARLRRRNSAGRGQILI